MKSTTLSKITLATLLSVGAMLTAARTEAGFLPGPPVDCPMNYAPVICSNGIVYGNSCLADADGATGCTPYSIIFE